jgi:hypothetical protein
MFKENFLHYIWRLQYFTKANFCTTSGENICVLDPGIYNHDAGPDFTNARVKIGDIEWCGNIELHINSSDWTLHHHQSDLAYNNIILHVTYKDDQPVRRDDGSLIPTLELKGRIDERLILKYSSVSSSSSSIACRSHFDSVPTLTKISMIDKAMTERLIEKSSWVLDQLHRNMGDWQETNYQLLSKNFGFNLNSDPFFRLAKALPFKLLLKHRGNQEQVEALMFGQAGLLDEKPKDDYQVRIKREYDFLSKKYSIESQKLQKHEWKFLRIRPANFPTVRISQLASIISQIPDIITSFTEFNSVNEVYDKLSSVMLPEYWRLHYTFADAESIKSKGMLGKESIQNIIINTIAVLYFAMGMEKDNDGFKEKAVELIETVPAESNKITKEWERIGYMPKTAYDSQGVIQLFNNYCKKKACLSCDIGASIFKSDEAEPIYANKSKDMVDQIL